MSPLAGGAKDDTMRAGLSKASGLKLAVRSCRVRVASRSITALVTCTSVNVNRGPCATRLPLDERKASPS